jgi:hypothetical protein
VIADAQWKTVQEEDHQNRELLAISNQILTLTKSVDEYASQVARSQVPGTPDANGTAGSDTGSPPAT